MQIAAEFVTSAAGATDFRATGCRRWRMVGRSNVGKSSLINALVRQPLARTSAAPGKTRLANFFRVQPGNGPAVLSGGSARIRLCARGGDAASAQEFSRLDGGVFRRPGHRRRAAARGLAASRARVGSGAWRVAAVAAVRARRRGNQGGQADARPKRDAHARELESLFQTPVPLVSAPPAKDWTNCGR